MSENNNSNEMPFSLSFQPIYFQLTLLQSNTAMSAETYFLVKQRLPTENPAGN